jgi:hypothetical protein
MEIDRFNVHWPGSDLVTRVIRCTLWGWTIQIQLTTWRTR